MPKRFIFFYLMKNDPGKIRETVPAHVDYWKRSNLNNYLGGPFADRTGGLITFEEDSIDKAEERVEKDPFVSNSLIEKKWVKEWLPE